jgi:SAM-dependent methyltransferase
MHFHQGNALNPDEFPNVIFDLVISTGLGEFLKDEKLKTFYANVYRVLKTGGSFYTSATSFDGRSDRFLRVFELDTEYRNREQLEALLRGQPWSQIRVCQDEFRLQTFVRCTK